MRYYLQLSALGVGAALACSAGIASAAFPPTPVNSKTVSATTRYPQKQLAGHECSLTAWDYFSHEANGHQPWFFMMHFGAGTSCAGGGGIKSLRVSVSVKLARAKNWTLVAAAPVLVGYTRKNPLRLSSSWHSTGKTPEGTIFNPVLYRVDAFGAIAYSATILSAASVATPGRLP